MIEVLRGDKKNIELAIKDKGNNSAPLNLTGLTIYFMVKENLDETDSIAKINKSSTAAADFTVTNSTAGEATLHLTPTDTNIEERTYKYDLRIRSTSDGPYSIEAADFIVRKTVRKAFSA